MLCVPILFFYCWVVFHNYLMIFKWIQERHMETYIHIVCVYMYLHRERPLSRVQWCTSWNPFCFCANTGSPTQTGTSGKKVVLWPRHMKSTSPSSKPWCPSTRNMWMKIQERCQRHLYPVWPCPASNWPLSLRIQEVWRSRCVPSCW